MIPFAVRDRLLPVVGASIKLMIGLMEACEEFFRFVTLPVSANRSEGIVQTILFINSFDLYVGRFRQVFVQVEIHTYKNDYG